MHILCLKPLNKAARNEVLGFTTKAAMNRPQRFRGLATDPGVQRKAPEAVIRRAGTAVGKTIGMDSYRASSAERSTQDRITEKPGHRRNAVHLSI
jgi:hypothetical protein